jgi:heavy metal sensor kinase
VTPRPPRWQLHSLRVRVTLCYLAVLLVVLLAFGGAVYAGMRQGLQAEMDHALELVAVQVIDTGDRSVELDDDALPPGYVASMHETTGRVLATGKNAQALPWDPDARRAVTEGHENWRSISIDGQSWRIVTRPIMSAGSGTTVFQVGRPQEAMDAALAQLRLVLLGLLPLALVVGGVVGMVVVARALAPIDRITRTAERIGAEDLTQRLPEAVGSAPDEVGRLAATFNRMLDRLENAFKRQRQFTADASHELRTPLTLLLTQLDVTLSRARVADEYEGAMHSMRADVLRLQRLVEALLTLARADAGRYHIKQQPLDLGDLVEKVAQAMQAIAREHGVVLNTEIMPDVRVVGDEARLTELIVNLVQNALQYTPRGGTVSVAAVVEHGGAHAALSVTDTGIGIAAEHLPHLFERFYRVDAARSSAVGGTGLGLSISRAIAEAHGGRIDVESEPGKGSTFTFRLPCTRQAGELRPPTLVPIGPRAAQPEPAGRTRIP